MQLAAGRSSRCLSLIDLKCVVRKNMVRLRLNFHLSFNVSLPLHNVESDVNVRYWSPVKVRENGEKIVS